MTVDWTACGGIDPVGVSASPAAFLISAVVVVVVLDPKSTSTELQSLLSLEEEG